MYRWPWAQQRVEPSDFKDTAEAGEVAVAVKPRRAREAFAQPWLRAVAVGVPAVLVFLGLAGGIKALFTPSAATVQPPPLNGPTVEARTLDLATGCLRDAENYDPESLTEAEWRARLGRCFTDTPDVLTSLDPPAGQAAAEPLGAIIRRSADGYAATVVVRLRTSGSPLPVFRYYTVDVGCRPDGPCSLTTVPVEVSNLQGDPL